MFKADSSFNLLIGKSVSRTATVNVLDVNNSSYLADGEIVVLDENDTPLTAGTTFSGSRYISIVQRSGGSASSPTSLVRSARIDGANVIAYSGKSYVAPQEQISYLGFNGTSGSIDKSGTADYVLRLNFKEDKTIWSHYSNTRIWRYEPVATTDQIDIANYFAIQASNDSFSKSEVKVERLINVAATGTDAATFTFTTGSPTVTTSVAATAVAGDYVRSVTGVTGPAYKIKSVESTTSLTLDQPFQGTSGAVATPDYILAATAATAPFGIKFTGKAQTFTVGKFKYVKVKFDITTSNFLNTTLTLSQESTRGSGTGQEVAELEFMSVGFDGAIDKFWDSAPTGRADAVSTSNYDIITIEYMVNSSVEVVSGNKPARQLLILAIIDGAAQTTNILAQLNPWMSSTPRAFGPATV